MMAFGRKTELVSLLLELSGLNFLFGIIGLYLPKKSRKLTVLVLTLIVLTQILLVWSVLTGKF
jgi:hypothetical protein